jgi:glycosyltransferase involved in cell wall biosynthesis
MPPRPLRVLFDDSLAANPAGTGTFVRGLLGALRQTEGLEVRVSEFRTKSVASIDLARKAPARRLLNAAAHLRYFGVDLPARARRAGCDVIFSPTSLGPLRGRTPAVITVHDLSPLQYPATHHWISRAYLLAMLRVQLHRSAAVCTVSNAVRGEILARFPGLSADRVRVVPDAPDPALLGAAPAPMTGVDPPFFLMVGTIEPRKNHATVLRAFAAYLEQTPGARELLVLAGSRGWLYEPVFRTIAALGLEPRVRAVGRVEAGQLRWLYPNARALLFPSLYEGFGIPVVEAFALGCPVIAARIPSVVEVAGTGTATLLDPLDVPAWTRAMARAASAPPDDGMMAAARQRGESFSWEASARALRDVLVETAASSGPARSSPAPATSGSPGS